jgi:hypothetical protein
LEVERVRLGRLGGGRRKQQKKCPRFFVRSLVFFPPLSKPPKKQKLRNSIQVIKSSRIEEIRVTILQNLIQYHPESACALAWGDGGGDAREDASGLHVAGGRDGHDALAPLGTRGPRAVRTRVVLSEDPTGSHSELYIETTDRPGLLTAIVGVLKDLSVNVVSAEVDTEGAVAKDTFFVTYRGEPLNSSMCTLAQNALQYYLSQSESANDESY